jgi:hypothetical protein
MEEENVQNEISKDKIFIRRMSWHSNNPTEPKESGIIKGLKKRKSKSDLEREKRESEKLKWRDENCDNPSPK